MLSACIRCNAPLEPDPIHKQWGHCPNCNPDWVVANQKLRSLYALASMTRLFAEDTRGRPSIGGVKQ